MKDFRRDIMKEMCVSVISPEIHLLSSYTTPNFKDKFIEG